MIHNFNPIAFEIFGLPIRWYSLSYIFGFIFAWYFTKYILRRSGNIKLSYNLLDTLFTYLIVGIILGGRLGYVIFYNPNYYMANPMEILKIWTGGMSFHGGFIGFIISLYIFTKKHHQPIFKLGDILCLSAPVGIFFGRIANFINGELYGRPTTSSIGMIFPSADNLPRHPSQLYEALGEGLIPLIILLFLRRIKLIKNHNGVLSFIYLILYSIGRISVEFFREPDKHLGFIISNISMGQLLTIPVIIISIIAIILLLKRNPEHLTFITSPMLNNFDFATHFFFTRNGGFSTLPPFKSCNTKFNTSDSNDNVEKNRNKLSSYFSTTAKIYTPFQEHTNKNIIINSKSTTPETLKTSADCLITKEQNKIIGIITADCIPVIIIDKENKMVATIHCGWRGIFHDVIKQTINDMKSNFNSNPNHLYVALGPCLKQKSYEVDFNFMQNIIATSKKYNNLFKKKKNSKYLFNCTKYCIKKLQEEDIKHIETLDFNTFDNDFFSYRRSVLTNDYIKNEMDEGRQLSGIMIK